MNPAVGEELHSHTEREESPVIYLDNSATTYPKPEAVRRAAPLVLARFGANPGRGGYEMSIQTARAVYQTRKIAAELLHAPDAEHVLFTPSCTQAINTVIKGILQPGDHVVISCMEHNAVLRPIWEMKKRGVLFTVARVFPGEEERTITAFRECIKPNTKLIACTHASNVWGVRLPVERLTALAHENGAWILVDAAQTAGILPIDLTKTPIDFLCCAGHKGLYGPMGTGLMVFGGEARPQPLITGGTGSLSASPEQPEMLPDRYESGTGNTPGVILLGQGIRFVQAKGPEKILRHEMTLIQRLYRALEAMPHIRLYTPFPTAKIAVPVLSFNVMDRSSEESAQILAEKGIAVRAGLHCAPLAHRWAETEPDGAVRVSPSVFTSEQQIDRLIHEIKLLKK